MSSNLKIVKVCELCKQELIARKTTTQTCSDPCAKRLYKLRQRERAISQVEVETLVKRKPEAFVTEEQVRMIQAKDLCYLATYRLGNPVQKNFTDAPEEKGNQIYLILMGDYTISMIIVYKTYLLTHCQMLGIKKRFVHAG